MGMSFRLPAVHYLDCTLDEVLAKAYSDYIQGGGLRARVIGSIIKHCPADAENIDLQTFRKVVQTSAAEAKQGSFGARLEDRFSSLIDMHYRNADLNDIDALASFILQFWIVPFLLSQDYVAPMMLTAAYEHHGVSFRCCLDSSCGSCMMSCIAHCAGFLCCLPAMCCCSRKGAIAATGGTCCCGQSAWMFGGPRTPRHAAKMDVAYYLGERSSDAWPSHVKVPAWAMELSPCTCRAVLKFVHLWEMQKASDPAISGADRKLPLPPSKKNLPKPSADQKHPVLLKKELLHQSTRELWAEGASETRTQFVDVLSHFRDDAATLDAFQRLQDNWQTVLGELTTLMSKLPPATNPWGRDGRCRSLRDDALKARFTLWEPHGHHTHGRGGSMDLADGDWLIYGLKMWGLLMPTNGALAPTTFEIIKSIPNLTLAGFSILEPGTHLRPHAELEHTSGTRCHLGLIVPPECSIRVGHSARTWTQGRWLGFDGNQSHEVINSAKTRRAVLLLDIGGKSPPIKDLPEFMQRSFKRLEPSAYHRAWAAHHTERAQKEEQAAMPKAGNPLLVTTAAPIGSATVTVDIASPSELSIDAATKKDKRQ